MTEKERKIIAYRKKRGIPLDKPLRKYERKHESKPERVQSEAEEQNPIAVKWRESGLGIHAAKPDAASNVADDQADDGRAEVEQDGESLP